jgi:peptide/nickel transport system permease protein
MSLGELARPRIAVQLAGRRVPGTLLIGVVLLVAIVAIALLGPVLLGSDPNTLHLEDALLPPDPGHPMGTDNFGRDVFVRVINGAAIDLQIGLFSVVPPLLIGFTVGGLAAFYGGWLDTVAMRIADVVVAFPFFVLVIAIVAVLGPGLTNMYIAVAIVGWTAYARLVRSEVLVAKQLDYVNAARVLGFSDARIMLRHLVPNVAVQALIFATSDFVLDILLGSSLGFLGLGARPPAPEWGLMIADGRNFIIQAPWISTFPGFAIVVVGITFSLLGDGLADFLRVEERR